MTALPAPGVLGGLVALALVAGLELRVDARGPVSPMVATLVIAAVVVGGHAALGGAVVVAVLATGTAWIVQGRGWWAPLLAAGAATASAIVFDARPSRAGALAAALVFELVVVTRMRRIVWTMPLVCAAIALAYGWDAIGAPGALVFGAGALAIAATTAAWGAPPWASRVLGLYAARHSTGAHRAIVCCTAAVSLALGHRRDRPGVGSGGADPAGRGRGRRRHRHGDGRGAAMAVRAPATRGRRRAAARVLAGDPPRVSAGGGHGRRLVGGDPRRRARGLGRRRVAGRPARRRRRPYPRRIRHRGRGGPVTPLAASELEPRGVTAAAPGDPAPARWFAVGIFAIATAIGLVLIAAGLPLPEPLPILVLAVFVVFAVNRFTFFPSEVAVTAEAAVLATAIVAFRHDSAFVGPWCVALLAGPLDLLHWRQRSFVRMAYNAGNRMLATLAGAASFTILLDSSLLGTGAIRFGAAVLAAALSYAAVEGAIGVVLVRLHTGASWLGAARIELPLDALSVPLAVVGGAAGYLATEVGWWAATLVLVPTLFVPELALARPFRRAPAATRLATTIVPAVLGVVVLALLVPVPAASTLVALVVIAAVAGFELRVDLPVPPLVAALAAAAVLVSGDAVLAGAVVMAVTATTVSWIVAREASWWAPVGAGGAALVAAVVYDLRPSPAAALAAAVLFELLVATGLARVVWTAPFVCVAVALGDALAHDRRARCGGLRRGVRRGAGHRGGVRRAAVGESHRRTVGSCATAHGRCTRSSPSSPCSRSAARSPRARSRLRRRRWWHWRRRRRPHSARWRWARCGSGGSRRAHGRRQAGLVLAATVSVVLAYLPLAGNGDTWPVVILAAALVVLVTIAWPLVSLTAAGAAKRGTASRCATAPRPSPPSAGLSACPTGAALRRRRDRWPRASPVRRSPAACRRGSP